MDCIFCKIVSGEMDTEKVYEDEDLVVIHDINPEAPVHVLILPVKHFAWNSDNLAGYRGILGRVFEVAPQIAKKLRIIDTGYKLVLNCGEGAGQTIDHFHIHLLGGWR